MLPVLNAVLGDCVVLVFPVTKAAILEALQKGQGIGVPGVSLKKAFPEMFKETLEQLRGL